MRTSITLLALVLMSGQLYCWKLLRLDTNRKSPHHADLTRAQLTDADLA